MTTSERPASEAVKDLPADRVPRHIAIIMDGNNRWAKRRFMPKLAGHRAGVEAVRRVIEACGEYGVKTLTLFAFSSENWKRPPDEVSGLMELFLRALQRETTKLKKNNIRLQVLGDLERFSPEIRDHVTRAEQATADCDGFNLVVAANYGGQWDIAQSVAQLAQKVKAGSLQPEDIEPEMIGERLTTAGIPDPDLLIRTSGERRISNFLLWQCAYSEFYFTDTLWPDFGSEELARAVLDYSSRQRRYGMTSEQIEAESC
ncbi:isoprenyl transferase [Endozoicomonadaceae bacterium StTr2]